MDNEGGGRTASDEGNLMLRKKGGLCDGHEKLSATSPRMTKSLRDRAGVASEVFALSFESFKLHQPESFLSISQTSEMTQLSAPSLKFSMVKCSYEGERLLS
jgi:hypothetical protein